MEYIYVGQFVNTHGLNGEIRIVSTVPYKNDIFREGHHLYIGDQKKPFKIVTYRVHKMYDMVTLEGIDHIEQIEPYKGSFVWASKEETKSDQYFFEDLVGLDVYDENGKIGQVVEMQQSKAHEIVVIDIGTKRVKIPYVDFFIEKIDLPSHKMRVRQVEVLLHVED